MNSKLVEALQKYRDTTSTTSLNKLLRDSCNHYLGNWADLGESFIQGSISDLVFDEGRYLAGGQVYDSFGDIPGASSSGGANGTVLDDGVLVDATAPRTGQGSGLLVEAERTNFCPTWGNDNAAVGFLNAAGSLPDDWDRGGPLSSGSVEVVGSGEQNGVDYVDVRIVVGSALNSGLLVFIGNSLDWPSFADGEQAALGAWVALAGGSLSGVDIQLRTSWFTVGGSFHSKSLDSITPTSDFIRYETVHTADDAGGSGTIGEGRFDIEIDTAGAADFTLRIGGVQMERGGFATSDIKTTGSTVTRTVDSVTLTDLDALGLTSAVLAGGYTVYAEWDMPAEPEDSSFVRVWSVNDGTSTNTVQLNEGSAGKWQFFVRDNSVTRAAITNSTEASAGEAKAAVRALSDDYAWSLDGATALTGGAGDIPTSALDQFSLGHLGGSFQLNGYIKRLAIFPRALSDAELQALTTS